MAFRPHNIPFCLSAKKLKVFLCTINHAAARQGAAATAAAVTSRLHKKIAVQPPYIKATTRLHHKKIAVHPPYINSKRHPEIYLCIHGSRGTRSSYTGSGYKELYYEETAKWNFTVVCLFYANTCKVIFYCVMLWLETASYCLFTFNSDLEMTLTCMVCNFCKYIYIIHSLIDITQLYIP